MRSWRDCAEWREQKLPMGTTSNEACKLYDVTLHQLVSWTDDPLYGGVEASAGSMLAADPEFVLGHVLVHGMTMIGASARDHVARIGPLERLAEARAESLSSRELTHVQAIRELAAGNVPRACQHWERILLEHPTDLMALKFATDSYFYLGDQLQLRDSVSRVLPRWRRTLPMYSYLHGMHSFGLVQTNFFEEARRAALASHELNPRDAWASHTLAHYYEYRADPHAGIDFLRRTEHDWSGSNMIAAHNYWHLALYHVERDEHDAALQLFDAHLMPNATLDRTLDMVDLASMLFRLRLDGCSSADTRERWSKLRSAFVHRADHHAYTFNDAHVLMILNESGDADSTKTFFDSLDHYLASGAADVTSQASMDYLKSVNKRLARPLFDAICSFARDEHDQVVEALYPLRYELQRMGGSNAQRDMFHQMLTQSALRSSVPLHNKIGLAMLNERLALKPDAALNKRIAVRFAAMEQEEEEEKN